MVRMNKLREILGMKRYLEPEHLGVLAMKLCDLVGEEAARLAVRESVEVVLESCLLQGRDLVPVVQQSVPELLLAVHVLFQLLSLAFEPGYLFFSRLKVPMPEVELLLGHFFPGREFLHAPVFFAQGYHVHEQVAVQGRVVHMRSLQCAAASSEHQLLLRVSTSHFQALYLEIVRSVHGVDPKRVFLWHVRLVLSQPMLRRQGARLRNIVGAGLQCLSPLRAFQLSKLLGHAFGTPLDRPYSLALERLYSCFHLFQIINYYNFNSNH